jgi:hypothetical protein
LFLLHPAVDIFFVFNRSQRVILGLMGSAGVSKKLVCRGVNPSRHEPKKLALSVALAAALMANVLSPTLSAQTNVNSSTTRPVNRYLFIVETSRAMQPRANGVFDALKHALGSSLSGQIVQGDLVGIWTFNDVVYQELFPTQIWSQPTQLAFAVRLPTFADPELYQRGARLDKAVPEMLKVIASNENITIILVTTGDGVMQGTPFDAQINSAWKEWHDELDGIHMPLQTVIRAKNAQPEAWFMTPAPRPIDLARLEVDVVPKSGGHKRNNPAGVILESGLVTNQPNSLGTEQQVAFSVWALGQTSLTASATSKISTPQPKTENSAPPTADSSAPIPTGKATNMVTPQVEPSKVESAAVASKEKPNKSVVPASIEGQETPPIASNDKTAVSTSNTPPADNGKPVELVFVTNAPAQPAPVAEAPVKESPPVATPSPASVPPAASAAPSSDLPNNHQQILAHARAADPAQEEKQGPDVALATPPRGFLRDNIQPLLLMTVAGFGAMYCFRMWLRTNARPKGSVFSLTQTEPDEQIGQEQ